MTLDFQKNLLKYLIQVREVQNYIEDLDSNLFDLDEDKSIFSFIQSYVEKYKYQPSQVNLIEHIDREDKANLNLDKELKKRIIYLVEDCYIPIDSDTEIYHSTLIEFAQRKKIQRFLEKNADALSDSTKDLNLPKWIKEFSEINNIKNKSYNELSEGAFLFKDFDRIIVDKNSATPTFLKGLNMMTADGGFFSPQLITVMSGPKGFKTGTCVNLAKNFVMTGKKVFYADFENSYRSILNRVYQSLLQCTKFDLLSEDNQVLLNKMIRGYYAIGGDLRAEYFPAHISNLDMVDNKLKELSDEQGWEPDIIIYDYLDLAGCADRTIKERRLQIQYNYHHAIRLNNKYKTFAITMSQISKEAWKEMQKNRWIDMTAFSEDFGKAMNCHAAFAICRSQDDVENKIGFLIPIVQREGMQHMDGIHCSFEIKPELQLITENLEYTKILQNKIKSYYSN